MSSCPIAPSTRSEKLPLLCGALSQSSYGFYPLTSNTSLHAKKYDEAQDIWQARVNRNWRIYFTIAGDTYRRHPAPEVEANYESIMMCA